MIKEFIEMMEEERGAAPYTEDGLFLEIYDSSWSNIQSEDADEEPINKIKNLDGEDIQEDENHTSTINYFINFTEDSIVYSSQNLAEVPNFGSYADWPPFHQSDCPNIFESDDEIWLGTTPLADPDVENSQEDPLPLGMEINLFTATKEITDGFKSTVQYPEF